MTEKTMMVDCEICNKQIEVPTDVYKRYFIVTCGDDACVDEVDKRLNETIARCRAAKQEKEFRG